MWKGVLEGFLRRSEAVLYLQCRMLMLTVDWKMDGERARIEGGDQAGDFAVSHLRDDGGNSTINKEE